MTMPKKKDEILLTENGFYFGHQLKDGSLGMGARRITETEIMTMFTRFFDVYCEHEKVDSMVLQAENKVTILVKRLPTEIGKQ